MSKPTPLFRSIGEPLNVSDDALNKVVEKLGVPSLVKPDSSPAHVSKAVPIAPSSTLRSEIQIGSSSPAHKRSCVWSRKDLRRFADLFGESHADACGGGRDDHALFGHARPSGDRVPDRTARLCFGWPQQSWEV